MEVMKEQMLSFLRDEEGLTMVEYAVAGALITAAAAAAFLALGEAVTARIEEITVEITGP